LGPKKEITPWREVLFDRIYPVSTCKGLRNEGILREKIQKMKLSQSECQWYHLKARLKSFTMSTNVDKLLEFSSTVSF
jgi:hypothetical protein